MKLIIRVLKRCYHGLIKLFNCIYVLFFFIFHKKYTIVWVYPHIGDLFYGLPCAKEYKRITNNKMLLVGNINYEKLYRSFEGIDKYHLTKEKNVWRFLAANNFRFVKRYLQKKVKQNKYIPNDIDLIAEWHPIDRNRPLQEYTQLYVYGLPKDFVPTYPLVSNGKRLSEKKYIILAPFAQTAKPIDTSLFLSFVNDLKELGFDVFSNVHGTQKELEGTTRLDCSLEELCSYTFFADAVVTLRSGVSDMLGALTRTDLYVLFNGYTLGKSASVAAYRKDGEGVYEYYEGASKSTFDDILSRIKDKSLKE